MEIAQNQKINQVIVDTAGRLQNKKNLMDELKKIGNVIKKSDETAPHEVILVLDATSGQNIMGIFEKFKIGFKRSASNIASGLKEIIVKKEIDDTTLDKIEEFLIGSDVGIDAASEIKSIIAQKKIDPKNDPIKEVFEILNNYILELMTPLEKKDFFLKKEKTNIILV